MSDARLESTLDLDIAAALRQVDRLNADVSRATTDVPVTADTRAVTAAIDAAIQNARAMVAVGADTLGVTSAIDAAVARADTAVAVTAEAADVTGSITAAVDAADTNVVVTGDASELTGDVTAAVDAADTQVTVTGQVDQGLRIGVQGLGDDLADATQQAGLLRGSIGAISAAGILAGLYQAATAASDLGESSSKASVVFGESFGEIERIAENAATAVGLSKQAALEATGTFGNLFQALGTTQEEAAALAPEVVQLAGDLASFNNLGVDEVLEKMRSGLVGEIEPLRSLGISFGAAEVEAKALELGLASANGEISEGAKVQARFKLITEQTTLAQGDYARTADGLANQQRTLNAEFDNAVASAGEALLPALLDLVGVARSDLIPAFGSLAADILPPFASIVADLAPLLGSAAQFAVLLGPPLALIAEVVDAIPTPLLLMVGAMVAFNKASGPMSGGLDRLAFRIFDLAGGQGFAALNPLVVAGGVALAGFTAHAAAAAERQRRLEAQTRDLTEAFKDEEGTVRVTSGALTDYLSQSETVERLTKALGLSVEQFSAIALQGADGQRAFAQALKDSGIEGGIAGDLLEQVFGDLQTSLDDVARAQIIAAAASGAITQARADEALASRDLDGALRELQGDIDAHAAAVALATEKYGPQIAAAKELGTAYTTLSTHNRGLADDLVTFREEGVENDKQLAQFIIRLGEAALSEEEMGAAAALLGTDMETLQGLIDSVSGAVGEFVDSVVSKLPQVSDAFAKESEGGITAFVDNLRDLTARTDQFLADLDLIFAAGGQDIAATLAQQGVEAGAAYARQLAESIAPNGRSPLVTTAEQAVDQHNQTIAHAETYLREEFGPAYIASTGLVASLASEALGTNLTFAERTRIAANLAQTTLDEEGKAIALIAATEGARAATEYARLFKIDDDVLAEGLAVGRTLDNDTAGVTPAAARAADRAAGLGGWGGAWRARMGIETGAGLAETEGAISGAAPSLESTAGTVGAGAGARLGEGFTGEATAGAHSAVLSAGDEALIAQVIAGGNAFRAGAFVGRSFSDGLAFGIEQVESIRKIRSAAAHAVREAEDAARDEAQTRSPSLVWRDIGLDLMTGLSKGIAEGEASVTDQAVASVENVSNAVAQAILAGTNNSAITLPGSVLEALHEAGFSGIPNSRVGRGGTDAEIAAELARLGRDGGSDQEREELLAEQFVRERFGADATLDERIEALRERDRLIRDNIGDFGQGLDAVSTSASRQEDIRLLETLRRALLGSGPGPSLAAFGGTTAGNFEGLTALVDPVTTRVDPLTGGGVGGSTFVFDVDTIAVGAGVTQHEATATAEAIAEAAIRALGAATGAGQVLRRQRATTALRVKGVR